MILDSIWAVLSYIGAAFLYLFMFLGLYTPSNIVDLFMYVDTKNTRVPFDCSLLNPGKQTLLFIHGWGQSSDTDFYNQLAEAYLSHAEHNIIIINWSPFSENAYNLEIVVNLDKVSNSISETLNKCQNQGKFNEEKLTIVGFSLGAQIASRIGKWFKAIGKLIYKIHALEAAKPGFSAGSKDCISRDDAKVVFCLHTSEFGITAGLCHADFIANSGLLYYQPGCSEQSELPPQTPAFLTQLYGITGVCSHNRAYKYFVRAITCDCFLATGCEKGCNPEKSVYYGYNTPDNTTGISHFKAESKLPYAECK